MEEIISWEVDPVFSILKFKYSEGEGFVTRITPMEGCKLKINGRDWLDAWGTYFTLESFQRMVGLMFDNHRQEFVS